MKIGILSDSHDHLPNIRKALEAFKEHGCEKILHAGDFVSPFVMTLFKEFNIPFIGVFGNNDGDWLMLRKSCQGIGEIKKGPIELELHGRKIALMHEPVYLEALRNSKNFDLIVHGHTHAAKFETQPALLINPGETCGYITRKACAAICDLAKLTVEPVIL